ncbi:MAG: serine acetyltransferase [Candidatus Schekmanbacteria bacterium]|nr:serine acetyltransferase [Candidatus Schekmanbacteria bacterium]
METLKAITLAKLLGETGQAAFHDARCRPCAGLLPSRREIRLLTEAIRAAIFPGFFSTGSATSGSPRASLTAALRTIQANLCEQIRRALCFVHFENGEDGDLEAAADDAALAFLNRLPQVQRLAVTDVEAAYVGDPAATSRDEVVLCYPGLRAITSHRIAHELQALGVPLLPRMIAELSHGTTGIDIHPGATIGEAFFIDHGTGVVIGETCVIGKRVRVYQGVTLGAKSFPVDASGNPVKGVPRHPIIEDDVVIYAEATILGRITIGRGSIIGGNVWLTRSVPPHSRVSQQQPREESFVDGGGI